GGHGAASAGAVERDPTTDLLVQAQWRSDRATVRRRGRDWFRAWGVPRAPRALPRRSALRQQAQQVLSPTRDSRASRSAPTGRRFLGTVAFGSGRFPR